jgi:DNA polymerase III beta subunit
MLTVIQVNKKQLTEALNIIQVGKIFPILENVRLTVNRSGLILEGYDYEVYTAVKIPYAGTIDNEIKALIPKKALSDIVKKLKDKEITITITDNNVVINGITLKTNSEMLEEYPNMDIPSEHVIDYDVNSLFKAIRKVEHAMAKEPEKFYINGLCLNGNEVVGTDGHRLALYKLPNVLTNDRLLIPYKTVKLLMKLKPKSNNITIQYNTEKISFTVDNITILSHQLENRYPNYYDVIPGDGANNIVFKVNKQDIIEAIEKIIIVDNRKEKSIALEITDNMLTIKTALTRYDNIDFYSEMVLPIEVLRNTVGNYRIGFNGKYLIDALSSVENEAIIKIINKDSQITILDNQDNNYLSLVMPMEIQ